MFGLNKISALCAMALNEFGMANFMIENYKAAFKAFTEFTDAADPFHRKFSEALYSIAFIHFCKKNKAFRSYLSKARRAGGTMPPMFSACQCCVKVVL